MPGRVDLHTHTLCSDGRLTPQELLTKASGLGVQVISITDHDTTAGFEQALAWADLPADLRILPGIEVSSEEGDESAHILGYGIDSTSPGFQDTLTRFRECRMARLQAMVESLQRSGIPIDFDQVKRLAGSATVGRPHIADALVEKKVVRSRQEAFQKYLRKDGPAYVPSEGPTFAAAIQAIREAGGVPVLAHPSFYSTEAFIEKLIGCGLLGIEVYYPDTSRALKNRYLELAKKFNLVATGGSDYHGPRTGRSSLACEIVPETVLQELEEAKKRL